MFTMPTKKKTTTKNTKPTKKPTAAPDKPKRRKPPTPHPIQAATPEPAREPEPIEIEGIDGLNDRQRVFCDEYLRRWNATEAARIAGYNDPEVQGWRLKQNAVVKSAIDARLKSHHLGADEVLARLADHAMGSMEDFVSIRTNLDTGNPEPVIDIEKARRAGKLHLIKKIRIDDKGTAIELYDADAALTLVGKHHELFTEKQKIEGEVTTRITNLNDLLKIAYGPKPEPPNPE
jgi:phage terminase small subunit